MANRVFATFFDEVPEPRVQRTRRHKLTDVLLIVLMGTICGCTGWDAMHDLVATRREEFREILELPHGVPCADTLRRVMSALDPAAFSGAFTAWAQALCASTEGKVVSIDGKTLRGAFAGEDGRGALHLINAWVKENAMVLAQHAVDVKDNEITAIPELIKLLDLKGAIVTIDAIGCQRKIAQLLHERGAEYVFGLKSNQPSLHREVLDSFDETTCKSLEASPKSFDDRVDKGHGRLERRRTWVQHDVSWLAQSEDWPGLRSLVLVESERTVKGEVRRERRAYVSSVDAPAARMSELVRGHWHVENKLHWVLDVTFSEDRTKIAKKNGAANLAVVRKVALNMLQHAPSLTKNTSIAAKKRTASWRVDYLKTVLASGRIEGAGQPPA